MKFNCGISLKERITARDEQRRTWHKWFALIPRRVSAGECRWLEYIERKGETYLLVYGGAIGGNRKVKKWRYEYRVQTRVYQMGISSYVDWPPENPLEEELINLEYDILSCKRQIKTLISCRKEVLKYDSEVDCFIDEIQKKLKLKSKLRKQLFVFHLEHGQVF